MRDAGPPEDPGDIDLLVDDSAGALAVLRRAGFVPLRARGHGSHRFAVGFDETSATWTQLDLVSRLDFGSCQELRTELAKPVLAARVSGEDGPRPAADDAFWLLALQLALRDKPVGDTRRAELARLATSTTGPAPATPAAARVVQRIGPTVAATVLAEVMAGSAERVDRAVGHLGERWRQTEPVGRRTVRRLAARLLRHLPIRTTDGLSLAVVGPDGAGKTTLLQSLSEVLPVPSRYVYMGVWRTGEAEAWARHVPGARLLLRLLRLGRASARASVGRRRGQIVLLDRFTLDAALPSDDLDWRGRISAVLVKRIARAPDRIVLLDGPPAVMFARKGEHGVEELTRRRTAYLDMLAQYPQMLVVDATQSPQAVRAEVTAHAWRDLARGRRGAR